ncbi:cell division protein FtsZ, partial [Chloroflexota bacterium]
IMAQILKERFKDKAIYSLVALPFEHEEKTDARTFYNSATCLKAINSVADAVFLVDNQRFVEKDSSLINNMTAINRLIAEPFYDLLCAGEENKAKNIGARLLDAGDIMQTLSGWSVLGYGATQLPVIRLPFSRRRNFRKKSTETHNGIQAMNQALSNLSLECNPHDSASALYLLSAPTKEMNMETVKELANYLSEIAPKAIIRYGDYPRGGNSLTVTVILSQLNALEKIKEYYDRMPDYIQEKERAQGENEAKLKELADASMVVPSFM